MNFEPVYGEDNSVIGFTDDFDNFWTLEEVDVYWSVTGTNPYERTETDESWFDSDALASAGFGTDEDYGF